MTDRPTPRRARRRPAAATLTLLGAALLSPPMCAQAPSDAERMAMVTAARDFNACMRQAVVARAGDPEARSDVRRLLDAAATQCEHVLEQERARLSAAGVDPDLIAGFVRRTRDQSLRRLLPEVLANQAAGR
ncbi:MAG: hypothetical protein IT495_06625 [Gammaproteobacteria bacterium]|nr:hypothetical protein [Gammaproteobacteria bacterium]